MKWRMRDWKHKEGADLTQLDPADAANDFSVVEISFMEGDDSEGCEITVKQAEIPPNDKYEKYVHLENLEGGWRKMIFERIEQVFGYPIKK